MNLSQRPRRNRKTETIRNLTQETWINKKKLIYPLFLLEKPTAKQEISSMPGIFRLGLEELLHEIEECLKLGIFSFVIFPVVEDQKKDKFASYSYAQDNFYLHALRYVKEKFPETCIITDVAMDPYSSDGHDGLVENGKIINDKTLEILAKMSLAQAQTGIDYLGPSDMMDGRVGYIREHLDQNGYTEVGIISYTAKYASAFYGPFRDALDSAPRFGDKKTYQMNPANARESEWEAELDFSEGADILMVKPALAYLDIIYRLKNQVPIPIAAYNVSGEYSMIKASAKMGYIDEKKAILEVLTSIFRAGADIILTYHAKEMGAIL